MSLIDQYHAAHKARLLRMGAQPRYQAPVQRIVPPPKASVVQYPAVNIQTLHYHEMWFYDLITQRRSGKRGPLRISEIQRATEEHFAISKMDMLSSRRTINVARPRQIAMYLSKTLTLNSLPEIGRRFGRDHTTILHGIRTVEAKLPLDEGMRVAIEAIKAKLR